MSEKKKPIIKKQAGAVLIKARRVEYAHLLVLYERRLCGSLEPLDYVMLCALEQKHPDKAQEYCQTLQKV